MPVRFENYAGHGPVSVVDLLLTTELQTAGIEVQTLPCLMPNSEVQTHIFGVLHGWSVKRAWSYWVCEGPGIPLTEATILHTRLGQEVRVNGSCACPSPREAFHGLGTGSYHVDTHRGLEALANTIKIVVRDARVQPLEIVLDNVQNGFSGDRDWEGDAHHTLSDLINSGVGIPSQYTAEVDSAITAAQVRAEANRQRLGSERQTVIFNNILDRIRARFGSASISIPSDEPVPVVSDVVPDEEEV